MTASAGANANASAGEDETILRGNKALITVGAMLAGLMAFLDISIVNVALNDIRANFGTPLDRIAWVSTSYAMANITIIPMSGWLLKRFGFRRYYAASILVFTAASVLCGLSWDLLSLVLFRILQGLGGGAIIPTSQSVLFSRYPEKQHGMAGALFAIGAITGPLLGPTIGGYLVEWASWHWIFFVNLPFGLFAAYIAWTKIEQPKFVPDRAKVDRFGIALLAIGMVSLQYVLEEGNRDGWFESTTITVLAVVAAIAIIGFISHELEVDHPVVELRVFANRGYTAATALNFLVGTVVFAGSLLLSLYCGTIMHYRALDIGRVFLLGSWIQLFIFPLAGKLVTKVDPRLLLVFANVGIFTSLWLNAHLTPSADTAAIVTPLFIRAVGTGIGFVPLTFLAVASLPPAQRPGGTALFNLTRELGASIGTAWMSTMLDRESKRSFTFLTSHVDAYGAAAAEQLAALQRGPGARLFDPEHGALAVLKLRIAQQALLKAFNSSFLLLAIAFLSASWLILVMRRPGPAPAKAAPTQDH
ncbi:DHA2 family efflux MFS transporter permease subunit [Pendulispora albinea]|uniref:DHA2 family efflux MFS transporter permease subunit n=1 Tax=Pendulispora albinea TaxID=2741071 RepID=A0ABZ2LLW7_9BACT